jgi:hypothetical protein
MAPKEVLPVNAPANNRERKEKRIREGKWGGGTLQRGRKKRASLAPQRQPSF